MGEVLRTHNKETSNQKALQLVIGIFEHSQGDPSNLEKLFTKGIRVLRPSFRVRRVEQFLNKTTPAVTFIVTRRGRHPIVEDMPRVVKESLIRLHGRLKEPIIDIKERETLIPQLAEELICRDWYYLVHKGGRKSKKGLSATDKYDPNLDKWQSYLVYYGLWKDENGNRRSTGLHEFDVLYGAVGDYLEQVDLTTLTPTQPYSPHNPYNDGTTLHDKLMRMIDVYNDQQEFTLGAPQRKVWEGRVQQYFAA